MSLGDEGDGEVEEREDVDSEPTDETGDTPMPKSEEGDGDEEPKEVDSTDTKQGGDHAKLSDTVKTVEALEDKLGDLTASSSRFSDPDYIEYPKWRSDVVVSPTEIYDYLHKSWRDQYEHVANNSNEAQADQWFDRAVGQYHKNFTEFKREVQSEVNYMVKEFECKKSATAYARATTARTGVLDCTKLHTYKYNEDLFKKVTNLPEGKNHGLVFTI